MRAVGSSLPRIDAADKVTGVAAYPGDINLPGQAWMTTVFAGVPHARVRALHVDAARSAPGVVAVLTAADVPVNSFGLNVLDQPVLCGPDDHPGSTLTNTVRWEGDRIALVIAETQAQAEVAAKLVRAEFEELPLILDPEAATLPHAIQVHDYAGHAFAGKVPESNILLEYHLRHGDMAAGFAQADVIIEATYRTHAQEHAYLQPEAGVAFVRDDGRLEVIVGGQWMHEDREQIAHALGLPDEEIVVRYPAIGGAFGGREDMSVQILLALATQKTGRPVKTIWSREESIRGHHKRHPYILKAKWGATKEGKLVAAQMDVTADAGSYASTSTKVLGNATLACLGPYEIPNVYVDARAVYTHNCPNGAFRGFGGPQGHFAAEMQMNKLAHALGLDPVDFRLRNTLSDGAIIATGSPMPAGVTIAPVIEAAATEAGWVKNADGWHTPKISQSPNRPISQQTSLDASKTHTLRGIGMAACFKNVGFSLGYPENAAAFVELHGGPQIERAIVGAVGADVGQGAHSAFRQLAAQVLGIPVERVEMATDNTDITGSSGSASASRLTFMQGNAIVGAAQRALQGWQNEERPARADHVHYARKTTGYDPITGAGDPNITYGYCAQTADVEIDVETGHVTVKRLVSANDVGMAINPKLVEGQIEGAVAQSVGWTLLENVVQRNGHILNANFSSYLIPGVLDVVEEIVPVILEFPDPQGPLGARGMAEMPFIPTAPAIAAAIHNATGVWMDELPFTPERVWRALQNPERIYMPVNANRPELWKSDVAQSIDFYNSWFLQFAPKTYRESRVQTTAQVEDALINTSDLTDISPQVLQKYPAVLPILRMATAPPIARDRLIGLADVSGNLVKNMELKNRIPPRMDATQIDRELEQIGRVISRLVDPDIFPWLTSQTPVDPDERYRAATVVADRLCGAISDPIIRNAQEKRQLSALQKWLEARGYTLIPTGSGLAFDGMKPGTFAFRLNIPIRQGKRAQDVNIPIDAVIMPMGFRGGELPLLVEAKSAGDLINTNKRRKEEATKITQLRQTHGPQIRFILFLCGYFDSGYLGYEAAEGIDWVWEHRIDDLAQFGV